MRVLVACERFGVVRDAFRALGHDAWSCDVLPSVDGSFYHLRRDVREVLSGCALPSANSAGYGFCAEWDLMIAFPPCTYLCVSAAWAFGDGPYHQKVKPGTLVGATRRHARAEALTFVRDLMNAPIPRIAIENPRGCIGTEIRKADQVIHPWMFGDDASKETHLWLQNLDPLVLDQDLFVPGRIVGEDKRGRTIVRWANQTDSGQNKLTPSDTRAAERGKTYPGIARAMASQWGIQVRIPLEVA